ncbi:hypothetical protein M8J76_002178 [Diaphorina citri]|nr:hypothetical protein M8J75_002116 [Diaphorina citri]KAI5744430.1 hypothetical protein M8J76_002178 [Diaphorina citri]KAI5751377.1 hypothetical protein M8J77_006913 [Diaphorina citri]
MPVLPIPACVESFITGQELKEGMIILCIIIIIASLLPILLLIIFCNTTGLNFNVNGNSPDNLNINVRWGYHVGTSNGVFDDPITYATVACAIIAAIVLLLCFLEDIAPIIHFIMIVIWVLITIWIVCVVVYFVTHYHTGFFHGGTCGIVLLVDLICYILIAVAMVYGVIVYWSFYAESD